MGDYHGGLMINWQLLVFKSAEYITQMDMTGTNIRVIMSLTVNESSGSVFLTGYEEADLRTKVYFRNQMRIRSISQIMCQPVMVSYARSIHTET